MFNYLPADSDMLLYVNHKMQQGNLLSCAVSLPIAIHFCMFIINCSKVFFIVCLYFPSDSHTLLFAITILQQGNNFACANISLLMAIRCYMLIMNNRKVICIVS